MKIGCDKPLYVVPFDHRATFSKTMFGWQGLLSPEQTAQIAALKEEIYEAFKACLGDGAPRDRAGILVDEQFGAAILHDARSQGFITACPAEKAGRMSSTSSTGLKKADIHVYLKYARPAVACVASHGAKMGPGVKKHQ